MKHISFYFLLIIFITACSSSEDKIYYLKVSPQKISFKAIDEAKYIEIESNDSWTITGIPSWLSLDTNKGEGDGNIKIIAEDNPLKEVRSAKVKVSTNEKEELVEIIQNPKDVTLSISHKELRLPSVLGEGEFSFEIQSNDTWLIEGEIPNWCTLSLLEGEGNAKIKLTCEDNVVVQERSFSIKIVADKVSEELIVIQEAPEVQLSIFNLDQTIEYESPYEIVLNENFSIKEIIIDSNTKWKVSTEATWCTLDKKEGASKEKLSIAIDKNISLIARESEINIVAGDKEFKILVYQSGIPELSDNTPFQINLVDNAPVQGDEYIQKQIDYVEPGNGGANVVWDFSNIDKAKVWNDAYKVSYELPPYDNDYYYQGYDKYEVGKVDPNTLITQRDHQVHTMYYFRLENNLLLATGHENPTVQLDYNPRMVSEMYPTVYNSNYKHDFKLTTLYSGKIPGEDHGYTEMLADGYGKIILPSGEYENVLRIKYTRAYLGGESPYNYYIYKWFVKGYRYPVLEVHNIAYQNSQPFKCSFYLAPERHMYKSRIKREVKTKSANNKKSAKVLNKSKENGIFPIINSLN